jgi:hypothetical protein
VVAQRRECKDSLSIFECDGWTPRTSFEVATHDLADVRWGRGSGVLCVVDSILKYQVLFYDVEGRCLHAFTLGDHSLGAKSIAWDPSRNFLAVGSFDERARLLNHASRVQARRCLPHTPQPPQYPRLRHRGLPTQPCPAPRRRSPSSSTPQSCAPPSRPTPSRTSSRRRQPTVMLRRPRWRATRRSGCR